MTSARKDSELISSTTRLRTCLGVNAALADVPAIDEAAVAYPRTSLADSIEHREQRSAALLEAIIFLKCKRSS